MEALLGLHRVLKANAQRVQDCKICVLVGFDDVQSLQSMDLDNVQIRHGMSRVFALIERCQRHVCQMSKDTDAPRWHLFFPLLATNGRLSDLKRPITMDASYRGMPMDLLPPFLCFPFDLHAKEKAKKGEYPLRKLSDCPKLENLQLLGRPLWNRYATADVLQRAWEGLFNDRQNVLFAGSSGVTRETALEWWAQDGRRFAMLSRRFHLPPRFGDSAIEKEHPKQLAIQVDKHMRQLLSINKDDSERWTAATSEPILSHIAFEASIYYTLMRPGNESRHSIAMTTVALLQDYQRYANRRGTDTGNVAAQILLLAGIDEAKLRQTPMLALSEKTSTEESLRQQYTNLRSLPNHTYDEMMMNARQLRDILREEVNHVVTVAAFLEGLLSAEAWQSLQEAKHATRFLYEMRRYSLYLTHFTQTFSNERLKSLKSLRRIAHRGAGYLAPPQHEATDVMIPIFRNDELANVTLLQVKVRNARRETTFADQDWATMEAKAVHKELPMIHILMDFQRNANGPRGDAVTLDTRFVDTQEDQMTSVAHWRLRLNGATKATYRCVEDAVLAQFLTTVDDGMQEIQNAGTILQCAEYYDILCEHCLALDERECHCKRNMRKR